MLTPCEVHRKSRHTCMVVHFMHPCQFRFLFIPNNMSRKEKAYLKTAKQIAGWLYNLSNIPDGKLPKYWWRSLHCKCRKKDDPERSAAAMFVSFQRLEPSILWDHSGILLRAPLLWRNLICLFSRRQRSLYAGWKIFFCAFCFALCTVTAFSKCTSTIDY